MESKARVFWTVSHMDAPSEMRFGGENRHPEPSFSDNMTIDA